MNAKMLSRVALTTLLFLPGPVAMASSLKGSNASMVRQHAIAVKNDFTFAQTSDQLRALVADQRLIPVRSTSDLLVTEGVSFAYTRPILELFLDRLASQYRQAFDERLVVTSLTRPIALQPSNASPLSVHPAGMAIDFRVPDTGVKRAWLEQTLLALEDKGVLDVTREKHPPHYHVAVFPEQYAAYLTRMGVDTTITLPPAPVSDADDSVPVVARAAAIAPAVVSASASGLRYVIMSALGYFLAVLAAGLGTVRGIKRS